MVTGKEEPAARWKGEMWGREVARFDGSVGQGSSLRPYTGVDVERGVERVRRHTCRHLEKLLCFRLTATSRLRGPRRRTGPQGKMPPTFPRGLVAGILHHVRILTTKTILGVVTIMNGHNSPSRQLACKRAAPPATGSVMIKGYIDCALVKLS